MGRKTRAALSLPTQPPPGVPAADRAIAIFTPKASGNRLLGACTGRVVPRYLTRAILEHLMGVVNASRSDEGSARGRETALGQLGKEKGRRKGNIRSGGKRRRARAARATRPGAKPRVRAAQLLACMRESAAAAAGPRITATRARVIVRVIVIYRRERTHILPGRRTDARGGVRP